MAPILASGCKRPAPLRESIAKMMERLPAKIAGIMEENVTIAIPPKIIDAMAKVFLEEEYSLYAYSS